MQMGSFIRDKIIALIVVLFAASLNPASGQDAAAFNAFAIQDLPAAQVDCSSLSAKKSKKEPLASYEKLLCFLNPPGRQLDSAYYYLNRTLALIQQPLKAREQRYLQSCGLDVQHLLRLRERLVDEAFAEARRQNTVQAWNSFLHTFGETPQANPATALRDEALFRQLLDQARYEQFDDLLAQYPQLTQVPQARERFERSLFERHTQASTAEAFLAFARRFPESPYATEALKLAQLYQFQECMRDGTVESYAAFLKKYPENPYVPAAEDSLFQLLTRNGNTAGLLRCISEHPNPRYVLRAWQRLYAQEVTVPNGRAIEGFLKKYPNCPFASELREEARFMGHKFYTFTQNGLTGYISLKTRQTVVPARFRDAGLFSEGLAAVRLACASEPCHYAYVTPSGRLIDTYPWTRAGDFYKGRAVAAIGIGADMRYGIINHAGEWVVAPRYTEIQNFHEGLALVRKTHYGFVDEFGNEIIPCIYPKASTFSEGLAAVQDPQSGLFGFIDRQGRYVIAPQFAEAAAFREGLAAAADPSGRWGYVDRNGRWIIAPSYDFALPFINGKANVMVKDNDRTGTSGGSLRSLVIDKQGRRMAP